MRPKSMKKKILEKAKRRDYCSLKDVTICYGNLIVSFSADLMMFYVLSRKIFFFFISIVER